MWHVHKALNIQDPSDMYQAPYIHGTLNIHKTPAYMGLNPATQRWHSVLRTSCPRRAQQVNWQPGLCSGTLALASLQWHVSWAWSTFHFWTLTQSSPLVLTTPQSMGGHKDRQDIWMLHDHSLKSFHSSCSLSWVCFFLPPLASQGVLAFPDLWDSCLPVHFEGITALRRGKWQPTPVFLPGESHG